MACKHQYNVSIREDGMHHLLGIECTIGDKLLQTQALTLCSKWCRSWLVAVCTAVAFQAQCVDT